MRRMSGIKSKSVGGSGVPFSGLCGEDADDSMDENDDPADKDKFDSMENIDLVRCIPMPPDFIRGRSFSFGPTFSCLQKRASAMK